MDGARQNDGGGGGGGAGGGGGGGGGGSGSGATHLQAGRSRAVVEIAAR